MMPGDLVVMGLVLACMVISLVVLFAIVMGA